MPKQITLAAFDFTKKADHRGKTIEIPSPTEAPDESPKLKCSHCNDMFTNQQGLSVHLICKHGHSSKTEMKVKSSSSQATLQFLATESPKSEPDEKSLDSELD